jgi:hypothetical protein
MPDTTEEIAALKRELGQLKAAMQPPDPKAMEREARAWRNQMHQLSEGRMSRASAFSKEDLAAMEAATPTSMVRDIAMRDNRAPSGPSAQGVIPSSQPLSAVRVGGSGTSGWAREIPLSNPPGVNILDRIMDHQDAVDRHERMVAEARRQALLKAASKP